VKNLTIIQETSVLTQTIATEWRTLASCRDSDPTLFFPIGTTGFALDQIASAKVICGSCSVQEDCLQYALQSNQESGVWGGYAEDERRRLRKRWLAERRRRAS
jgi:WhiB family redox-sensing transcriptional regulator